HRLLAKTGLKYEFINQRTVRVEAAVTTGALVRGSPSRGNALHLANAETSALDDVSYEAHGADFVSSLAHLSRAESAQNADNRQPASRSENNPEGLAEVVVTAQKREERLLDVPVPVSAINAEALTETDQFSLVQYASSIPSLNYQPGDPNGGGFIIRGLN